MSLTKIEFEKEFAERIRDTLPLDSYSQQWHKHVEDNMHLLSTEALHYILHNETGDFFGQWMMRKAWSLVVEPAFEEIVIGVQDGN